MSLFVRFELCQFHSQYRRAKPRYRDLTSVDIHRAMFTRVVYLDDPPCVHGGSTSIFHEDLCMVSPPSARIRECQSQNRDAP